MKIKFPKIKKSYQKEIYKIDSGIYWRIIVGLFFVLVILSFIFAYNLYFQINKEDESFLEVNSEKVEKEKKEKINKVLEYFAERQKNSDKILNSAVPLVDPSI